MVVMSCPVCVLGTELDLERYLFDVSRYEAEDVPSLEVLVDIHGFS